MSVRHFEETPAERVAMPGASGCTVRWLVGARDNAPNFAMRQFEVEPGGFTPKHQHPYEHEVYVLEGQGVVLEGETEHALSAGQVIYMPPNELHQFRNTGTTPMKFLCMVPNSAMAKSQPVAPECGVER